MRPRRSNVWGFLTDERVTYALKLLMGLVLVFFVAQYVFAFLARIQLVIYVLVGAVFFAYLIYPAVHWLRQRMPLGAALGILYGALLLTFGLIAWFVLPHLLDELTALARHYPLVSARVSQAVNDPKDPIVMHLPDWARTEIAKLPDQIALWVQGHGFSSLGRVMTVLSGTAVVVATFVVIPVVAAYLLFDLDNIKRSFASLVPPDRRTATFALLADVDGVIGGFIRGQLIVAVTVGILITIALELLHVRYAFLLGLLAAIGDLIPYVGAVMAFIPAFVTAIVTNGFVNGIFVLVAFVLIFEAEGHLIAPNIVSKTVHLSPFTVIVALLIGGELAGLFGMLVAVPVAGALRVVALRVFKPRLPNPEQQ